MFVSMTEIDNSHFQSFQTSPLKVGDEFILKPLRGKKGKKMMRL